MINKLKTFFQRVRNNFVRLVNKFPLASFFAFLILLVVAIAVGNQLRKPKVETARAETAAKQVQIFDANQSPQIQVQAQVEKTGVVKIVAQTSGIVQNVRVKEGDKVGRGTSLLSLSSNYQGGNSMSVARQINQRSYQFQTETYDAQKETINRNRELANKGETQATELRAIARASIEETKTLISLNEEIFDSVDDQLNQLIANNGPAADIAQLRSTRVQVLSALSGLRAGLRNTEYLNSDDKESAEIARLSRDNTLKQLEIQEKSIDLGKDLAQLNLKMSQINEAMMYPAAPYAGVVERVYVKVGQSISPGTVLATIKGNATSASAVALVSREVAQNISGLTESKTVINEKAVALKTRYVSQEATDGSLHSVIFTIPDEAAVELSATSYIQVEVPVGMELSSQQENFIPLDAVYQGQSTAYVYVAEEKDGKLHAVAKTVKIGHVFGHYVEVTEGLQKSDKVITNRNVIDGDLVALQ